MKLLFMHNAIPEYRIPWFNKINAKSEVYFVFTNEKIIKKKYNFDTEFSDIAALHYELIGSGLEAAKKIKKLLKEIKRFDFIMLPPCDSLREFYISYLLCWKAKKNHIPISFFWEKWEAPRNLQPIKRKLINLYGNTVAGIIFNRADLIFAGSTSSKDYFEQKGIESEKIVILPDASETPRCEYVDIRKKYNIPPEKVFVLFFGRLLFQKGAFSLVRAFAKIDSDKYHLLIAGDGQDRERTERYVRENGINNVIFAGEVHPSQRYNYFNQCDIFVFPGNFYQGRTDVWGLTVVEAIQNGKPVISTTAIGSAIDLIKNGVNGFLLDATLEEDDFVTKLAECITRVYKENIIEKAALYNEQLRKKYSFDAMTDVFLKEVEKCTLKKKRS